MSEPVALAVAAHPDDIEFMMTGTLLLLGQAGYKLHMINLASGCCGSMDVNRQTIATRRLNEAREAARVVGAKLHDPIADDVEVFYTKELVQKMCAVVRIARPTIMLLPSPEDYMEDHMTSSRLAVTAAFVRGMPNFLTAPPRNPTSQPVTLYHALPYGLRDGMRRVVRPGQFVDITTVLKEKRAALFAAALAGYNDASERAEPAISGNGGLWGTSRVIIAANAWIALECGTMKNDTARRMLEDLTWQYAPSNGLGGSVPQQPTPEARLRACLTRGIDVVRQEDTIGDTAHQIGLLVNATDNPQPDHVIYAGRAASRELSYRHEHGRRNEAREAMLTEKIASAARFLADHLSIADRPLDIGDLRIVIPSGPWPGWTVKRRVAAWLKCSPDLVPERAKPSAEREQADEL